MRNPFKRNRFVAVNQFLDLDRKPHIIVMTRNAVYEYDPTGKAPKKLFTLKQAEALKVEEPSK